VTIDGQEIITATPEKWTASSAPVQLTEKKPVAIRVDYA